ncbi:U3 small nucleolar RNAassociated protein 18 putativ, related, partial [Eimeria tenella]
MGEKTKTQRPRKRKVGGPPSEAPEGPPRSRARRKERRPPPEALEAGGPPQGPPKGPPKRPHKGAPKGPPQQDEEAQQQLRALETLLFGAPTATAGGLEGGGSNGEGQEAASRAAAAAAARSASLVVDIAANPKLRKLQQQQQEKQISGEEFHRRLQALHRTLSSSSSSSSKQSLLWIQEARERKRRALEESELLGELPSGLESTGQEGPLSKGEGLVAAAAAAARKQRGGPLGAPLAAGKINVRRLEDANKQGPSLCAVSCLDFHPKSNILLTAGRDKTLRLFLVDGAKNPRLESVHLKDFPVSKAFFSLFNFGETLLMTSSASRALAEYDLHRGS